MDASKGLTQRTWERWLGDWKSAISGFFVLGVFLGVVPVSMWQQWGLAFGQDPELLLAVSLILSLTFWLGQRWQSTASARNGRIGTLVIYLSAWSVLHPFWVDALASLMSYLPLPMMESGTTKPLIGAALAAVGWIVPGMLWSATLTKAMDQSLQFTGSSSRPFVVILSGIATGLILNSLILTPQFGAYIPMLTIAFAASVIAWRFGRARVTQAHPTAATTAELKSTHLERSDTDGTDDRLLISSGLSISTILSVTMAFFVGILLACHFRLLNQLMPHNSFVIYLQMASVLIGVACGFVFVSFRRGTFETASWGGLIATASSSVLLALQPNFVDLSLRMNVKFTTVALLLVARTLLMLAAIVPFGVAFACVADFAKGRSPRRLLAFAAPFAAGMGVATFALGGSVGLIPLMSACLVVLLVCTSVLRLRLWHAGVSLHSVIGTAILLAVSLSFPIWTSRDDASRTAKLLYSTPAFIAYRSGWDLKDLPYLDDIRLIDRQEGRTGPLTLWRGRVAELYIREAGIPRAIVTRTADAVPQFSPEVLQAVYSMVISDRPDRVLFLGLSAGVPLSTCLNFPIREAVCMEGDSNLVNLVRGPVTRETGFDPLTDDRVTLHQISPELAMMAKPSEPYDVILSCPLSSAMMDGAPSYTSEFYQRVSSQLAGRGLFCQRFECVDFGPEPLRLVLKSMQSAFRKVVGFEISAGEILLFAANSDDVFVPSDLANRLETSHVRKILARSGLDWSALLNVPAYDDVVLKEISDESRLSANSCFNGLLAARSPMEVMRWGNKHLETQKVLTATRNSIAPYWNDEAGKPRQLEENVLLLRRSRIVDWLGDANVSQELMRRLGEVDSQLKLVRENPDAHWWAYRKALQRQLQLHPRTAVQQVKAIDDKKKLHPEDTRRLNYFVALGNAARRPKPTRQQIAAVEEYLEPYDPLVSYFARQETADLLSRCGEDAAQELAYRLYVIYFAPAQDASVRNVATAIETLVNHPETIPDNSTRFDALNGLVQTLRVRWEIRQSIEETSSKKSLGDVEKSLLAAEKGVTSMDELAASAGIAQSDWQARKQVLERLMLRPLRTYRTEVANRLARGEAQAKAMMEDDEEHEVTE